MTATDLPPGLLQTAPQLTGVALAADCIGLAPRTLLHAGPPLAGAPVPPILNAAVHAVIAAGWESDPAHAARRVLDGEYALRPAQDAGVVTPLAGIVTASTPLQIVVDAHAPAVRAYAPINVGLGAPIYHGGVPFPQAAERLRFVHGPVAEWMDEALRRGGPIPLWPLVAAALAGGDECHSRTNAGSVLVRDALLRCQDVAPSAAIEGFLKNAVGLFLPVCMAFAKCIMQGIAATSKGTFVTAACGNGETFGIQVAALPGRWFTQAPQPPRGPLFDPVAHAAVPVVPAMGDSAVIDCLGLGAQAIRFAPELAAMLGTFQPADADAVSATFAAVPPPLAGIGLRLGLDARRVSAGGLPPYLNLGMLDARGEAGILGRGVARAPIECFAHAVRIVDGGEA